MSPQNENRKKFPRIFRYFNQFPSSQVYKLCNLAGWQFDAAYFEVCRQWLNQKWPVTVKFVFYGQVRHKTWTHEDNK